MKRKGSIRRIQNILRNINGQKINNTDAIYLNIAKNEFITLKERIKIPRIPVKELNYDLSIDIIKSFAEFIPQFLFEHDLLVDRNPPSEQHNLHFIKEIKGQILNFIHILKINLKFGGDSKNIINKGNSNYYPSYETDRIYYKSRLIPVNQTYKPRSSINFDPIKLFQSNYVESDQYFHTYAIFDSIDYDKLNKEIYSRLKLDVFNISQELYPFIKYDYFTSCFNVLDPRKEELLRAVNIFEPIFLLIYSKYHNISDHVNLDNKFQNFIISDHKDLVFTEDYILKLKTYFNRFVVYRDKDLALKGWWRIDIDIDK